MVSMVVVAKWWGIFLFATYLLALWNELEVLGDLNVRKKTE